MLIIYTKICNFSLAQVLRILLHFLSEMKKILIFGAILSFLACAPAVSAVRDSANVNLRTKTTTERNISRSNNTDTGRTATTRNVVSRNATPKTTTRAGTLRFTPQPTRVAITRPERQVGRTATTRAANLRTTTAREATATTVAETRTGAAYNKCKDAYFQCMDQFCQLKNDDYRRCSCSARIYNLKSVRANIGETNSKITEFTENLDVVGLTAAQATAMHTASDGENALAADTSASKALLEAIMNSIRGNDATVSGKLSDLNSINISFDTSNAFGLTDTAQVIASYDGTELYNAVYPSCRGAVAADCTDAALQRAVTAYLMAIEQDCNTVQTALENKQKELKSAIREGGAMLDLARVENRRKHNSDTLTDCINNIENAIVSEQVCGANYHKCLDNGEFIDVSTGAPISGVKRFYELANLLKFDSGKDAVDQQLSKIAGNQKFVKAFESKTKKFAKDSLDKCTEIADTAWAEYLDRALLAIYYAQQSKVETIKNGCFDLISTCYTDKEAAITAAMSSLIDGTSELSLMPGKIVLTQQMCNDYIESCNNMFADDENNQNIITDYITMQTDKDRLDACRAIAQQCFSDFGGTNYENFYYPSSGLFKTTGVDTIAYTTDGDNNPVLKDRTTTSLDWFTLYRYDENGKRETDSAGNPIYVSECAKRVASVSQCADIVAKAFGGLDTIIGFQDETGYGTYSYKDPSTAPTTDKVAFAYGWAMADNIDSDTSIWTDDYKFQNRRLRPTGIATDVYNNIIDSLSTQCMNNQGKFIEAQFIDHTRYGASDDANGDVCRLSTERCCPDNEHYCAYEYYDVDNLNCAYGLLWYEAGNATGIVKVHNENMCPKDYSLQTDTRAWGICSCWENGGRRSKNGLSSKCMSVLPIHTPREIYDAPCDNSGWSDSQTKTLKVSTLSDNGKPYIIYNTDGKNPVDFWCSQTTSSSTEQPLQPGLNADTNQVCPITGCDYIPEDLPKGI